MKIKQTVLILASLLGLSGVFLAVPVVSAATCGGVKTSIISCDQKGVCPGGEDPYKGTDPGSNTDAQKNYKDQYHHEYGKCKGGTAPSTDASKTGLWGLLIMAINILTAGVGIAAVAGIVIGSVMYMTAGDSPDKIKKANIFLTNVILGIIVYAAMWAFLNFLIPGGMFQ